MSNDPLDSRDSYALQIMKDAGDIAHEYFNRGQSSLTIRSKVLQNMTNEGDLNTEFFIRSELGSESPLDAFLEEETGTTQFSDGRGIWVVDAIDGTQPFISVMSSWYVSIAFVQNNTFRLGSVYAPARGELFAGDENHPATLTGVRIPEHPAGYIADGIVGIGYLTRD